MNIIGKFLLDFDRLNLKLRRVFIRFFSKYYTENHFKLLREITPEILETYIYNTAKINSITESNNESNESNENKNSAIIIILANLEKFKSTVSKMDDIFNVKFLFKYFEDTVLKPSIFSIYHIIYFVKDVDAVSKYNVYKLIYLVLECTKFLFENIKEIEYEFKQNRKEEYAYFANQCNKHIFLDENITKYINETIQKLDAEIKLLNNEKFQQLNYHLTMEMFVKYTKKFKNSNMPEFKLNNEQNDEQKKDKPIIEIIIDNYISMKANYFSEDESNNNILNKIFSIDNSVIPEIEVVKLTMAYDLIYRFELGNENSLNEFNDKNNNLLKIINKLFKTDPDTFQLAILNCSNYSKLIIDNIITKQLVFLFQFWFIEFNKLNLVPCNSTNFSSDNFINCLEFLRLLCENHNKIFQTLLLNYEVIDNQQFFLINFLFKIPSIIISNIDYFKNKKSFILYFKNGEDNSYFNSLIEKITDFLIEIIQGAYNFNFDKIATLPEFNDYYETHYKVFDYISGESDCDFILSNFMRFVNCYLEENTNSKDNKALLIKRLNPNKLFTTLIYSFKKIWLRNNPQLETINHEKLIDEFAKGEIDEDPLFNLSNNIFIYFKRVTGVNKEDKVANILSNLRELSQTDNNKLPKKGYLQNKIKKELSLFYDKIIKEVEIAYRFKDSLEESVIKKYKELFEKQRELYEILFKAPALTEGLDLVVFKVHPTSLYLLPSDKDKFIETAPYDNFNMKFNYVLDYYPTFVDNLEMRRSLYGFGSKILIYLSMLNYKNFEIVSALLSFITCVGMLLSTRVLKTGIGGTHPDPNPMTDKNEINLTEIEDPYKKYTDSVSIIHLLFLSFIIINWFGFKIFQLRKSSKYSKNSYTDNLKIILSYIFNEEIFPFIWNFMFGLIAYITLDFIYALQLFTIFNIFPTMSSVLYAVRIRYKQFLSTFFLLVILMLFYASITIYFFKASLTDEENLSNSGNIKCRNYLECFLYLINSGIRSGGIDFSIKKIGDQGYWSEFVFDWIFYFVVILIVINIINGIIVDTFQALREQNNKRDYIKENMCFICSLDRSKFESKGVNFEEHIETEHNVLNYLEYIIKITQTDEHDLNSLDYNVLNSIKDRRTDFFPIKKAKCFEDKE